MKKWLQIMCLGMCIGLIGCGAAINLYQGEHFQMVLPEGWTIEEDAPGLYILNGEEEIARIEYTTNSTSTTLDGILASWVGMHAYAEASEEIPLDGDGKLYEASVSFGLSAAQQEQGEKEEPARLHYFYISGDGLLIDFSEINETYLEQVEAMAKSVKANE